MTKQITFTDLQGKQVTVDEEKARQLDRYIDKEINACNETISACIKLRDAKGQAEYEAKRKELHRISGELMIGMLS